MNNQTKPSSARFSLKRAWPLLILVAGLAAFFLFDLGRLLSFDTLQRHNDALTAWVSEHEIMAALAYVGCYIAVIAFSLPGGAVMTITGGFLFGMWIGTTLTVIGATIGATALFLAARTALGEPLRAKAGPAIRRMEEGFQEDALSYLLVLRLVPLFPFWLVNLAPAFLGVPLGIYVLGTFFGIIPGTFVYTSVGNGLGAIIDAGERPDLGLIFTPEILIPLIGLAILALIPVAYKKFKSKKNR
jgi:uncharacterized membrane protein YdjX (TVP38/TMEM64 family)